MEDLPWLADFASRPGGRARGAGEHNEVIRSASRNPAIRRSNCAQGADPAGGGSAPKPKTSRRPCPRISGGSCAQILELERQLLPSVPLVDRELEGQVHAVGGEPHAIAHPETNRIQMRRGIERELEVACPSFVLVSKDPRSRREIPGGKHRLRVSGSGGSRGFVS